MDIKKRILKLERARFTCNNPDGNNIALQNFNNHAATLVKSSIERIKNNGKRGMPYSNDSPFSLLSEIIAFQLLNIEPPEELYTALEEMILKRKVSDDKILTVYALIYNASSELIDEKESY